MLRPAQTASTVRSRDSRLGISLFEVILALVILVTSLAAIGELIVQGGRGAVKSRLMTQGVFLAESKMAELVSGAASLTPATGVAIEGEGNWTYDIQIASGPTTDLHIVTVAVKHTANSKFFNVNYELSRMMRDPQSVITARLEEEERLKAEQEAATAPTSSSSGSSSQGSGGQSGGSTSGGSR